MKKAVRQRREELRRTFGRYMGDGSEDGDEGGDNGDDRAGASPEEINEGMELISELDRLLGEAEDREAMIKTKMGASFKRTEDAVREDMARAKAAADPKKAAGVSSPSARSSRRARGGVKSVLDEARCVCFCEVALSILDSFSFIRSVSLLLSLACISTLTTLATTAPYHFIPSHHTTPRHTTPQGWTEGRRRRQRL